MPGRKIAIPPPRRRSAGQMTPNEIVPTALKYRSEQHKVDAEHELNTATKNLNEDLGPATGTSPAHARVFRTSELGPDAEGLYYSDTNAIKLAHGASDLTLPHEIGHALWDYTLPENIKREWEAIHQRTLTKPVTDIPIGIKDYKHDPSHSFAEMMGYYVSDPETLQLQHPHLYKWFQTVLGREYKTKTPEEADNVAAHIPFYWGSE